MKRTAFLLGLGLLVFFIFSGFDKQWPAPSIAQSFGRGDDKKDKTDYTDTYSFDTANSTIGFRVKHMGLVDVPGCIREFKGRISYDAGDVTRSSVEFTGDVMSIDTGGGPRDTHLKSSDFFDVAKYKLIQFKSSKVEKKGEELLVTGELIIKGTSKTITFPFKIAGFIPATENAWARMGVTAETTINRRDYGLNYGSTLPNGAMLISDEVRIDLQIEATGTKKPAPAVAAEPKE